MNPTFGDYELEEELGRGAMGVVYRARHRSLERVVALKMLISGNLASEKEISRFQTEARAAARLDDPRIVRVYDVGQHDSKHFLSMEYIEGESLADVVRHRALPQRDAAQIVRKIAEAISHAHQQGILHRDLKPANILLDGSGEPHVTDFGLAKHIVQPDYTVAAMTQSGAALGTPSYMPPEQAAGRLEEIRETADVYGLGAILYELVTGYAPFLRPSLAETVRQVLEEDPFPPRRLNQSLDKDLETICLHCLEKVAARRYQTAGEVSDELRRYLDDAPIKARPVSTVTRTWRWCRRNSTVASLSASVVVFLLLLAMAGGIVALHQKRLQERTADLLYVSDMEVAQGALESSNLSRVLKLLDYHREDPRRGFEWYYLWQRCHRSLVSPSLNHDSAVWGVAFSPRDGRLATGCIDGVVTLWDATTHARIDTLPFPNRVTAVAFSPDGNLIAASCGDGSVQLWDISTGKVRRFAGHDDKVWTVSFSPDGKTLASGGADGKILLWDVEKGQGNALATTHVSDVWNVAFSSDSSLLASAGQDGQVLLWDIAVGNGKAMPQSPGVARCVALSPDGRLVASGHADGRIALWDHREDKVQILHRHTSNVWSLQFAHDGETLISASEDGLILLWDTEKGEVADSILGHRGPIWSIALSSDGTHLASASNDQTVKIWSLEAGVPPVPPNVLRGHAKPVTSVAMRGDQVATSSQDGTVRIWNATTGATMEPLRGHDGPVWNVSFAPDGRLVSCGVDGLVQFWDPATGKNLATLPPHDRTVRFAVFAPDDSIMATGGDDEKIRLWDPHDANEPIRELVGHADDVQCGVFVDRGDRFMLATGSDDRTVRLWDIITGERSVIMEHGSTVWSLTASGDGRWLVSGGMDGLVQVHDFIRGETRTLEGHGVPIHAVILSPTGDLIISGGLDSTVRLWDTVTGKYRAALRGHTGGVSGLSFSQDPSFFVSASWDHTIRIWRSATEDAVDGTPW